MQSTDVLRTLQSGYSEYMGLFPPTECLPEQLCTLSQSAITDRALPPFTVRDASTINSELKAEILPNDFCVVAVPTFMNTSQEDDASYDGCAYALDCTYDNPGSRYMAFDWIADFAKTPLATIFDISPDVMQDFGDVYSKADGWIARDFEGLDFPGPNTFTNDTYVDMRKL